VMQIYQNRPQFTVHKLQRQPEDEVDKSDFFPASKRNPEEMFAELMGTVREIANPHLKALLEAMFADEQIARRYRTAPAAKLVHHAWLGGLIEHVLSLCQLCRVIAPQYAGVDLDLLLTGAILHDVGKIQELNYERGFGYSNDGQLLGHIVIGLQMIGEKLRTLPDFPPRLRTLVEHMILSHHGELEYGSPKVPLFAEALLLHHLDNLDSKMECVRGLIEQDRQIDGFWTSHHNSLDRPVLKKAKYLDGAPTQDDAPARAPAVPRRATRHPSSSGIGMPEGAVVAGSGEREGRARNPHRTAPPGLHDGHDGARPVGEEGCRRPAQGRAFVRLPAADAA
jgi:3'-5' exoribonuclease